MNRTPERTANSSMSVDFPILRRPRHVTKEATRFLQSPKSFAISNSLPKKSSPKLHYAE
jgi:hypothetical protein